MGTEGTPKEGDRVEVWNVKTGQKVFEGTVADVLIRPASDKAAEVVLRDDENVSDAK